MNLKKYGKSIYKNKRRNKMNDEQIKKIIEGNYDESKEDSLRSWFKDAYSKKMRWVMVCIYIQYIILLALAVFSAVQFFRADLTRYQIMYAAIFILSSHWMGFVSVFGWVMLQRPRIGREIKRLELRIAELTETLKK
jgi:hypothetical protein